MSDDETGHAAINDAIRRAAGRAPAQPGDDDAQDAPLTGAAAMNAAIRAAAGRTPTPKKEDDK